MSSQKTLRYRFPLRNFKNPRRRAGNAAVKNFDWRAVYQTSLTTEILRSERRRVTILSGLFVFAACVYTFLAFVPGTLTPEYRVRFQAQWPWIVSLYAANVKIQLDGELQGRSLTFESSLARATGANSD
jgi:hypothetical protein